MTDRNGRSSGLTLRLAGQSLLFVAAMGASCFKIGTIPARELYRISLPEIADTGTVSGASPAGVAAPLAGTLAIAQYATPGIYGDPLIVYRINDTEYNAYPTREWALPLSDQLGVLTERVLSRTPLTPERAVFDPPSRRSQTFIWRGTVREFEEVDRGSQVLAAVRIDVRIVRAEDDSIVWSGTSRLERPAQPADMAGIVQTLSTLADDVLTDLATRAAKEIAVKRP